MHKKISGETVWAHLSLLVSRWWSLLFPLIVIIVGISIYANTFDAPFVFDDFDYIVSNPAVKNTRYYFDTSGAELAIRQGRIEQNFPTRIVTFFTFALNYQLHGQKVWGYHLINLLVHLANGLLVYWLVLATFRAPFFKAGKKICGSEMAEPVAALFTALVFVAHPVQTQAVTYLSQRFTSLATMFYLLSLALYISWRVAAVDHGSIPFNRFCRRFIGKKSYSLALYWLAVSSAVTAMFCKEIAFTLPLIIILYEWMFWGDSLRKRLWSLLPFAATMLIIPAIIFGGSTEYEDINRLTSSLASSGGDNSALSYLFTQFRVITTYLRLLVLPIHQNLDYDYPRYTEFFQSPVLIAFIFICLLVCLGFYLLRRSMRVQTPVGRGSRLISFGIFWFFLTLSVESSIMPLKDVIFEHRVYLPSVGFLFAILGLMEIMRIRLPRLQNIVLILPLVVLVSMLSVAAHARNSIWRDPVALWKDCLRKSPQSIRSHQNLADEYGKIGRYNESILLSEAVLRSSPDIESSLLSCNALEAAYRLQNNSELLQRTYSACIGIIQKVLVTKGENGPLFNELGVRYGKMHRLDEAETAFKQAVRLKGEMATYHMNLGNVYLRQNRIEEALASLSKAVQIDPGDPEILVSLGEAHAAKGGSQEALNAYLKAKEQDPGWPDIDAMISSQYARLGNLEQAEMVLSQAVEARSDDPKAYLELGLFYEQTNRIAEAEQIYLQAIKLNDITGMVHMNLVAIYLQQGQLDKALEFIRQAAVINPSDPTIDYYFGLAYLGKKDYLASLNSFNQVLSHPDLPEGLESETRQRLEQVLSLQKQP